MEMSSSSFSFPVLDRRQIIKHLHEFGGPPLTEDDLLRPIPEVITPAYEFLVLHLNNVSSREELQQPVFTAMDCLGYPELHHDSVGVSHILYRVRQFMYQAGAADFSVWDITRPESQRTIRFLSAAINLFLYSTTKHDFLAELQESQKDKPLSLQESLEELQEVKSQVEVIEAERAEQQPQVHALDVEIKELGQHLSVLNKEHVKLQQDMRNMKQENQALADKITNVNFTLMEKQQERAQLQSQIVENPEKLKMTLAEEKKALQEAEASQQELWEQRQKLSVKHEITLKVGRKLAKWQKKLQALEEQVETYKSLEKELKAIKEKRRSVEKDMWAADAEKEGLIRKETLQEEMIKKLHQDEALKREEIIKDMESLQSTLAGLQARRRALTDKSELLKPLQKNNMDLKAEKEARLAKIDAAEKHLLQKVNEYNCSILAALPKEAVCS